MMSAMTAATGRQFEIRHGEQVAVVTEVGATLRAYDVAGVEVVDGFPADRRADGGRGQVLAPWPNRIRDGRYEFGGQEHQLALTEVANRNAIHGLVRWAGWDVEGHGASEVALAATVFPQPGYPFLLHLRASYALGDSGLTVRIEARNDGDGAAPYGVGHHPYLTVGVPVDEAVLTLPAHRRVLVDDRGNPVGSEDVTGTAYDFRSPRRVGDLRLDTAYDDLIPADDGRVRVRLEHGERQVELWAGAGARQVQVFSGDTLPEPGRRRKGLAVEPMSCPPGAFVTGDGLVVLEPGQAHVMSFGIRAH